MRECLLVAEEHLAHLLGNVAELVLVLAGELGDGGLRDVAELVFLVAREVAHLARVRARARARAGAGAGARARARVGRCCP